MLGKLVDQRFMSHRRRALRTAGLTAFLVADLLFGYRYFVNHVLSWDLLAVVLTIAVVYFAVIIWYLVTD